MFLQIKEEYIHYAHTDTNAPKISNKTEASITVQDTNTDYPMIQVYI